VLRYEDVQFTDEGLVVTIPKIGESLFLRSSQLQAVACGSRSTIATVFPARCAATARKRVRVVLPVPPF
jgi:hypothetical protein